MKPEWRLNWPRNSWREWEGEYRARESDTTTQETIIKQETQTWAATVLWWEKKEKYIVTDWWL